MLKQLLAALRGGEEIEVEAPKTAIRRADGSPVVFTTDYFREASSAGDEDETARLVTLGKAFADLRIEA